MVDFAVLLAAIDDGSLLTIIAAMEQLPDMLPALQAWIEHAARWEYDRRTGFLYRLQNPMAAFSPDELPDAIAACALIAAAFHDERVRDVSAVRIFFERLRETLLAEARRPSAALH